MTMLTLYDENWGKGTRRCGGCTLCCKLLPILEIRKSAGERCRHQRTGKGCAIYHGALPMSCRTWNCRWLASQDTADLRRPDRVHYVIDILPDHIVLQDNETGERRPLEVVQIWVDPDYPDAHRDPALRTFLERRGAEGIAAIVRYDSARGFTLFPPALSDDGKWHEVASICEPGHQANVFATAAVLAGKQPA